MTKTGHAEKPAAGLLVKQLSIREKKFPHHHHTRYYLPHWHYLYPMELDTDHGGEQAGRAFA